jgi:hypothetical protein
MSQGPFEQQIAGVGQTLDQGFGKDLVKTKLGVDGRLVYDRAVDPYQNSIADRFDIGGPRDITPVRHFTEAVTLSQRV